LIELCKDSLDVAIVIYLIFFFDGIAIKPMPTEEKKRI
jgi:hypothetical protein